MPTSIARHMSITSTADRTTARCVELAAVFQDQLLEEPPSTGTSAALRRRRLALITIAKAACRECPLITDCLYRAVVEYDVAGYVAGTTPPQRALIRRRLDIAVQPENFDTLSGQPVGIARSITARSYAFGTPIRTRAWTNWRSASAAPFQPSNVTCAASVGSPPRVRTSPSPPSPTCSPPRPSSAVRRSSAGARMRRSVIFFGGVRASRAVNPPTSSSLADDEACLLASYTLLAPLAEAGAGEPLPS